MRIDKWLWAARFFKTRALATRACDLSRVEWNGAWTKPARELRVGDRVRAKTEGGDYTVEVLGLSDVRGPAAAAQLLYRETPESREAREKLIEERRLMRDAEGGRETKPTRRDRREIARFRRGCL